MIGNAPDRQSSTRVTIVIPVRDGVDFTVLCLQSIEESQAALNTAFEVVLVDNASQDETPSRLAALSGDVRTIRNERDLGAGSARNAGAALSGAEYVLFLDNDTFVIGDWLDVLIAAMDEEPRRGAAQPRILYPDGRLKDAGGVVLCDGEVIAYGRGASDPDAPAYSVRRAPDSLSGTCLVVRRAAFEEVGGFDLGYAASGYDMTDLCFSLRARAWEVLYEPDAVVLQVEEGVSRTHRTTDAQADLVRDRSRFTARWEHDLSRSPATAPQRPDARLGTRAQVRGTGAHSVEA